MLACFAYVLCLLALLTCCFTLDSRCHFRSEYSDRESGFPEATSPLASLPCRLAPLHPCPFACLPLALLPPCILAPLHACLLTPLLPPCILAPFSVSVSVGKVNTRKSHVYLALASPTTAPRKVKMGLEKNPRGPCVLLLLLLVLHPSRPHSIYTNVFWNIFT